jgi:hypothetical protein
MMYLNLIEMLIIFYIIMIYKMYFTVLILDIKILSGINLQNIYSSKQIVPIIKASIYAITDRNMTSSAKRLDELMNMDILK